MGMKNNSRASTPEWPPQEIDSFEVFSCDLGRYSTRDLIFFLESSFQKSEYEKVAGILTSREKSLKAEIRRNCTRLEEQLTRIKEDLGVVQGREQRALERIDALSTELEKKEKERREEFVELKAANRDLECAKRRAENERDEWKKKFGDLLVRALRLVEENAGIIERRKLVEKEKWGNQSEENSNQWNVEDCGSHTRMRCLTMLQMGSARREAPFTQLKADNPSKRFIDITSSCDSDEETGTTANTLKSVKKFNPDCRKVDVLDDGKWQYKENCFCTSSSKRKHVSEMVASGRKSKNDDKDDEDNDGNDDKIPIGQIMQGKESRGTEVAAFLLDGIPRGLLKKSA